MFGLVSARYERASMIVASNMPFSAWADIFGDEVVAAAMIDRLVHHAEIVSLRGDSHRLRDKDLGAPPPGDRLSRGGSVLNRQKGVNFRPALTTDRSASPRKTPRRSRHSV